MNTVSICTKLEVNKYVFTVASEMRQIQCTRTEF